MTNFNYNNGVPATNNNPSDDQPQMLINVQSTENILAVDHISFSAENGGTHKQVTFSSKNTPVDPNLFTDPFSVLYTASGTASTVADLNFVNQNATFKINSIRAWGVFTTTATNGLLAIDMGMNVVSNITVSSNGQVNTISLPSNAVNGTTVAVLALLSNGSTPSWSYAVDTLTLTIAAGDTGGRKLSFAILQM